MVTYDERTALVVVDVQNDFADPNGSLYVQEGEKVVSVINEQVEQARSNRATVVYTQDWHPPSTPHFQKDGGIWPVHCVQGTWGAELHPDLEVSGDVVKKGTGGEDGYSGFTVRDPESGEKQQTPLEEMLRAGGVEKVVIVGLATDYCVKETAIDSVSKRFATTVLTDGIRAVDLEPGDGESAIEDMRKAGATLG
ncbi:MAG: isochorismatase family protein [Actinomycetota bacterium]